MQGSQLIGNHCYKLKRLLADAKAGSTSYAELSEALIDNLPVLTNDHWFSHYVPYVALAASILSLTGNIFLFYKICHVIAIITLLKPTNAASIMHPPLIYQGASNLLDTD